MDVKSLPKRLAEYFVICGLPKDPKTYDVSKIITHTEEIIAPEVSIDFTRFPEPIIDIKIVSLKEKEEVPEGYTRIKYSVSGKHKANIMLNFGEEACICYRRGRDLPYIKDIDTLGDKQCPKKNTVVLSKTIGGRDANMLSTLTNRLFLSYLRGNPENSIDSLAVTDLCIIIPGKQETCPPAYRQVTEPICISSFRLKAYICYRKSLVKQCIISYEPEVLYWYRVPNTMDYDFTDLDKRYEEETSKCSLPSLSKPDQCCDQVNNEAPDNNNNNSSAATDSPPVAPLDPDIFQVANFCLPWGASIESWSVNQDPPEVNSFTFMLTNESYQQLYGVALTFYEPYDLKQLDLLKGYCLGLDPELVSAIISSNTTTTDPMPTTTGGVATNLIINHDCTVNEVDEEEKAIAERQRHFLASRVGDRVIGVTKTICLLSRWSFTLPFSNFLGFLYSRCLLSNELNAIPFERYLGHFLFEIPFPNRAIPSVSVDLCAAPILLQRPDDTNASSSSCESFFRLLDNLNVDVIIQLFVQLLTEQKILMSSVRHSVLSDIGEALTCMIFPLKWTVVYIPYIYMGCIHVIQSPSPYLIGMNSRFFDFFRLPPNGGIAYLDLDTNNFKPPTSFGQVTLDSKVLPKKPLKQLKVKLIELKERIINMRNTSTRQLSNKHANVQRTMMLDCMFSTSNSELAQEELVKIRKRTKIGAQIKDAFFQFMVHLLKDYRACLIPVRNVNNDVLFNVERFLREYADKPTIPFYRALFETQQWTNFVRDRIYASSRDEELEYFDNHIELLRESESKSSSRLHHAHQRHHHHHQHKQQQHRSHNGVTLSSMTNLFSIGNRSSSPSVASSSHEHLANTTKTTPTVVNINHHQHHQGYDAASDNLSNHSDAMSTSSTTSLKGGGRSDESNHSQISSSDLMMLPNNNQCTAVIGPPNWPIPEFVEKYQGSQLLWTSQYTLGVIPTKINSYLLDLLAARVLYFSAVATSSSINSPISRIYQLHDDYKRQASIMTSIASGITTETATKVLNDNISQGSIVLHHNHIVNSLPTTTTTATTNMAISSHTDIVQSSHLLNTTNLFGDVVGFGGGSINSTDCLDFQRPPMNMTRVALLQMNNNNNNYYYSNNNNSNNSSITHQLGSLMLVDTPSPLLLRTNRPDRNQSLIGLTTEYTLPGNNETILKRSSHELRYAANTCMDISQADDFSMPKYLAATAYSIWFMLLPAYLSAVYAYYNTTSATDDADHANPTTGCSSSENVVHPSDDAHQSSASTSSEVHAMDTIKRIISQSIGVWNRMCLYGLEGSDQVALRILLVLLYQNRIENLDLRHFIDSVNWNLSSNGIANHIYKEYEREMMEKERIERDRLKLSAFRQQHRQQQQQKQQGQHDEHQPMNMNLTHRRSASAVDSIPQSVLMNSPSNIINNEKNLTGIKAPQLLTSSDDLPDLGYSTLNTTTATTIAEVDKASDDHDWTEEKAVCNEDNSMPCILSNDVVDHTHPTVAKCNQPSSTTHIDGDLHLPPTPPPTVAAASAVTSSPVKQEINDPTSNHHHHHHPHQNFNELNPNSKVNPFNENLKSTSTHIKTGNAKNISSNTEGITATINDNVHTVDVSTNSSSETTTNDDSYSSTTNEEDSQESDDEKQQQHSEEEEEMEESAAVPGNCTTDILLSSPSSSSAVPQIKRPVFQPSNRNTTSHNPRLYYSHHSSIDMISKKPLIGDIDSNNNSNSKHMLLLQTSPRKSIDSMNITAQQMMVMDGHYLGNNINHGSQILTTANISMHKNNTPHDNDEDEVESQDGVNNPRQAKSSVVHNALDFFNKSTSDFMNLINANRSLLGWRSLIPSLSTNPTPQSGRRATTTGACASASVATSCFTGSDLSEIRSSPQEVYHVQQYQVQSGYISPLLWTGKSGSNPNSNNNPTFSPVIGTTSGSSGGGGGIPLLRDTNRLFNSYYTRNPMNEDHGDCNTRNNNDYYSQSNQLASSVNDVLQDNAQMNYDHGHNLRVNPYNDLKSLKDMWINIAGPLLVGDPNRRMSPANLRTIILQHHHQYYQQQQQQQQQRQYASDNNITSSSVVSNPVGENTSFLTPSTTTSTTATTGGGDGDGGRSNTADTCTDNISTTPHNKCRDDDNDESGDAQQVTSKSSTNSPTLMSINESVQSSVDNTSKPTESCPGDVVKSDDKSSSIIPSDNASVSSVPTTSTNNPSHQVVSSALPTPTPVMSSCANVISPPPPTTTTTSGVTTSSNNSNNNNNNVMPIVNERISQLNVFITTCSSCPKCNHYVYDEEIMDGWTTDENDSRTQCPFCKINFTPQLSIRIFGDTSEYNQQSIRYQQQQQRFLQQQQQQLSRAQQNLSSTMSSNNLYTAGMDTDLSPDGGGGGSGGSPPLLNSPTSPTATSWNNNTTVRLMELTYSYLSPFVLRRTLETIIQREGDECLRCPSPLSSSSSPASVQSSLLSRHPQLTWNLVWLIHRLGLPTHLLDSLPVWLINCQSEQRMKLKSLYQANVLHHQQPQQQQHHHQQQQQHMCNKQMKGINSTIFTDSFYQVNLSPNLPVYISLRWNTTYPVRSVMRNPLYKYWSNWKQPTDQNTPWSLVPISPQETSMQYNLNNKMNSNLSISSACCPIHSLIEKIIDAIRKNDMRFAIAYLLQTRAHLQYDSPLPLTVKQRHTPSSPPPPPLSSSLSSSSPSTAVSSPASTSLRQQLLNSDGSGLKSSMTNENIQALPVQQQQQQQQQSMQPVVNKSRCRSQRLLCGDIKSCASCLEESLYRELLFLAIQALSRASLDLVSFDEKYDQVFRKNVNSSPFLTEFDKPPSRNASAYRQMLRPLTLRP
uniref:UDENN domain-containing protein n=1 Tax=Trichobilharzia regenti TaxID=157069 RepID=A0AA85J8G2_TRIRE|nr:unnamed protein product [Trichobilharzia regenti]